MKSKDLLYWIWFAEAVGPANADAVKLLKQYENPYEIFRCEEFEMDLFPGLSENTRALLEKKDLYEASRIVEACEKYQIDVLTYSDDRYPNTLRDIHDPPILLYYQGTLPDWNRCLSIGIVGTRKMTAYGLHFAYKIAYEMASTDTIVISGMASGIDGVAAAAALAAKGTTVAVLGSGLDGAYPYHHRKLKEQILKKGAVLSEYPPGTQIKPYHFPIRNRIISGISQGTLVVEAGTGSGSLITAQLAKKQGREVYAIPSNVGRSGAEGTNELLKDGAHMILESEDILERYQYIYASSLRLERLIEAKKNSSVDPAYLRSLDVAVFEVGEQKKNGAPYVKMTQSNERKPVEEKLREQYAQKNAPVGQFEQLSMLQPTEQVQNALPERGARAELTDTRARTGEFTKERPTTAINRTSKTRSDPKTEKAEKQPSL